MKAFNRFAILALGLVGFGATGAWASLPTGDPVEIPLVTLLAPQTGFNETNNVQVIAYGKLPNTCYHLDSAVAVATADPHSFSVHQFATHDTAGPCANEATLPASQRQPVAFTTGISLGLLPAGEYQFAYTTRGAYGVLTQASWSLTVAAAPTPTEHEPYAATSALEVPNIINGSDHVIVQFSGILTSTCMRLDNQVQVQEEPSTYVLSPTVSTEPGVECSETIAPFTKTLDLGKAGKPGFYLIQIKSTYGQTVSHIVEIRK